ncbi:MAG: restriction endonuclease subunit S [Prevotellaceae bacterium]|jgi:hypothetical protein|nr:restriction endonuclease subunit S [Prevotellaceae bacterium]
METMQWQYFRLDKIFTIKKGKRLTKADMIDGNINYIGATDSNNGITAKISNDKYIHPANIITVSYNGSVAEAFYQNKPFWATDDVNVLYPKFTLTPNIAMFLCTIIYKEKYRFNYGRKWKQEIMQKSQIKLPINDTQNPDWQWIENYVKNNLVPKLPQKAKAVWNNNFDKENFLDKKLSFNTEIWKWFRYDEIFDIQKGFYNKKPDAIENGNIPFIGATDSNNGITSFHDYTTIELASKTGDTKNAPMSNKMFKPNCITVSNNGSVGFAFYQPKEFTCTHDVNPLYLKNKELNVYIAMFLCTLIEKEKYRWAYGRKWRPVRMPKSLIKLPVTSDDTPDWQFMENYIKSLPYSKSI